MEQEKIYGRSKTRMDQELEWGKQEASILKIQCTGGVRKIGGFHMLPSPEHIIFCRPKYTQLGGVIGNRSIINMERT